MNKKGFTLVELLVVVLIIGVLTAVALPMYQGAVDKSHFSIMLPAARAIKNAEEAFMMANGVYTSDPTELDVSLNDNNVSYVLETSNDEGKQFNVVRLTNSKLPNVRLASYFDDNTAMAGQLHCEAKTSDERAERLCSKLLKGDELTTADGGYTGYLLDQEVDKATCDNVGRIWSNKNTKCFKTEQERCTANGMPYNTFCGYSGTSGTAGNRLIIEEGARCEGRWGGCSYLDVKEGGKCVDNSGGCSNSIFHEGSTCIGACSGSVFDGGRQEDNSAYGGANTYINGATCVAKKSSVSCSGTFSSGSSCIAEVGGCRYATFSDGASCVANVAAEESCRGSTIASGGKCVANAPGTCVANAGGPYSVIYNGGCCEGPYCPSNAPKCQD